MSCLWGDCESEISGAKVLEWAPDRFAFSYRGRAFANEQPQAAMGMQEESFLRKVPGVIHVGANSGQERDVYRDLGLRVLWIEANNEVVDELVRNIAGYPKQKCLCALLTDRDGAEYQFHIASNNGASSSIYQFGECLLFGPN